MLSDIAKTLKGYGPLSKKPLPANTELALYDQQGKLIKYLIVPINESVIPQEAYYCIYKFYMLYERENNSGEAYNFDGHTLLIRVAGETLYIGLLYEDGEYSSTYIENWPAGIEIKNIPDWVEKEIMDYKIKQLIGVL